MGCGIVGVLPLAEVETRDALGLAIELLESCRNRGEDGTGLLLYGQGLFPQLFHVEKWFGSAWPPIIGPCYAGIAIDVGEPLAEIVAEFEPEELAEDHTPLEEELKEGYEHEEFGHTCFDDIGCVSPRAVTGILRKLIPGDFCAGCFTGKYNYINPLNIRGKPYRYSRWLDEFIELNSVERPEITKSEEEERAGAG